MIQRVQTIWLLIAAACAFLSLKLSVYSGNIFKDATGTTPVKTYQELNGMYHLGLNISTIAIGVIVLICIFLYKNRKLQTRLCIAAIAIELLIIFQYYSAIKIFSEGSLTITSILQPAIIFLLMMAMRGIRKDERIISESDRLR